MTSRFSLKKLLLVLCIFSLIACVGNEENSKSSGIVVHFAEAHTSVAVAARPVNESVTTLSIAPGNGGYDKTNLEHHDIRDKNGRILSLYRAYIVIDNIELIPCFAMAQIPQMLMNSMVTNAHAHSGHGSIPSGGRSLDAPNVIDIVTQDEYLLALGDKAIAPGEYCGARIDLVRLANIAYGKPSFVAASSDNPTTVPEVPELAGLSFAIRAEFCTLGNLVDCSSLEKVDIDDSGLNLPTTAKIEFAQPLIVNKKLREAYVAIGINYGEWVSNVDITLLKNNVEEQQKLLENIGSSFHLYAKGLGDLPL